MQNQFNRKAESRRVAYYSNPLMSIQTSYVFCMKGANKTGHIQTPPSLERDKVRGSQKAGIETITKYNVP